LFHFWHHMCFWIHQFFSCHIFEMIAFDEINTLCYLQFPCCCQITWLSFLDVHYCFAVLLVIIKVSNYSSQNKFCCVVHVVSVYDNECALYWWWTLQTLLQNAS
jgi:hypothetical protein